MKLFFVRPFNKTCFLKLYTDKLVYSKNSKLQHLNKVKMLIFYYYRYELILLIHY